MRTAELYLEPASGTQQSTRDSRSSQTLPHGSVGDTCPRPPAHGGRKEVLGSHSNSDLQPGQPAISPETQLPLYTASKLTYTTVQCMNTRIQHSLTLSVHMSTHLSTDMFWMTALKGSANVTLSGRWKHPLKMALPSETDRTNRNVIHQPGKNPTIYSRIL